MCLFLGGVGILGVSVTTDQARARKGLGGVDAVSYFHAGSGAGRVGGRRGDGGQRVV